MNYLALPSVIENDDPIAGRFSCPPRSGFPWNSISPGNFQSSIHILVALGLSLLIFSTSVFAEPFSISRIKYGGGGDWYCDPTSLVNLQAFISDSFGMITTEKENVVTLADDDLFSHPYLYLSGHGNVYFTNEEAVRLRELLLGGGFLHVDDNYGLDESFRRELKKIFPDKTLQEVPFDHPIYHAAFPFPSGLPKIHEHDGKPAQGFAIFHEGRIVLFYTYECDLGDGWENVEVHNTPPEKHLAALQMGANIIIYALTGQPLTDAEGIR